MSEFPFLPNEAPAERLDLNPMTAGGVIGTKYQIVKKLGEGGMGEVFLASDLVLERPVAIKVLRKIASSSLDSDERFRHEARLLSRLSHPNVVVLHAFGRLDPMVPYIVMEYIEGEELATLLEREESLEVVTTPQEFESVRDALKSEGFEPATAEISMEPTTTVSLEGQEAETMLRMMDALEDLDDIQNVYANFEISEQEMAKYA